MTETAMSLEEAPKMEPRFRLLNGTILPVRIAGASVVGDVRYRVAAALCARDGGSALPQLDRSRVQLVLPGGRSLLDLDSVSELQGQDVSVVVLREPSEAQLLESAKLGSLDALESVEILSLRGHPLSTWPAAASVHLSNLLELDLYGKRLEELPESFGELGQLRELRLSGNMLQKLPASFTKLTSLVKLYLDCNYLEPSLPEDFGCLVELQHLDLRSNLLRHLPQSFGRLVNLVELELSSNRLEDIPESFIELRAVQRLYMGQNNLQRLPDELGNLGELRWLYLDGNSLTEVPASLSRLAHLQWLSVSKNYVASLPDGIKTLPSIIMLDCKDPKPLPSATGIGLSSILMRFAAMVEGFTSWARCARRHRAYHLLDPSLNEMQRAVDVEAGV